MKNWKFAAVIAGLAFLVLIAGGGTLADEPPIPIGQAVTSGLVAVTVHATNSLAQANVTLKNRTNHNIVVVIPVGTIFKAADSAVQSLTTVNNTRVSLPARKTKEIVVVVACIDMASEQPTPDSVFSNIVTLPIVARLAASTSFQNATWRVRQFSLWIMLSNPSVDDLPGLGWINSNDVASLTKLLGIDENELATLIMFPELALAIPDEDFAVWQQVFALLDLPPIQSQLDLALLFAYGGITSTELAQVQQILLEAGFDPTQFKIFAPAGTGSSNDGDGIESSKSTT